MLLAMIFPSERRPDVSLDPDYLSGFVFDFERIAEISEFINGSCSLVATDSDSNAFTMEFYPQTRQAVVEWLANFEIK